MQIGEYGSPEHAAAKTALREKSENLATTDGGAGGLSSLQAEALILKSLGFAKPLIARMGRAALANATTIERELLTSGHVREEAYYEALARLLGLPFVETIPETAVVDHRGLDSQLKRPCTIRLHDASRPPVTLIAPEAKRVDHLIERLQRFPTLRNALAIATPSAIRAAAWKAGSERRVERTVNHLFEEQPRHSARIVMTGRQGFFAGTLLSLAIAFFLLLPEEAVLTTHIVLSLLYLAALQLRLAALVHGNSRKSHLPANQSDGELPVYTVLVALYREQDVVPQLLAALDRLDWPRSRLDIKLVCEADDEATISAIRAFAPGPHIEIVEVPPMAPRTKPKALTYALAGARGSYVAVYDAEDRPHPGQLREAHARFLVAPPEVACLQAPLIITNIEQSYTSALFALEYSALFRRLLPVLSRYRMPLPLGGTSNHFRTRPLIEVGAWDPFNVTEDADLGMRLYRQGYRSETMRRQTLEDAPTTTRIWLGQRTRWFKGWLQTWLVLMREPVKTAREMGVVAFFVVQLTVGGMLISSLAHPAIIIFLASSAIAMMQSPAENIGLLQAVLFSIDFINIFGSYAAFLALGAAAMTEHEKKLIGRRWAGVPFYWVMTSVAAWRAVFELRSRPFFWNKTPHKPAALSLLPATTLPAANTHPQTA